VGAAPGEYDQSDAAGSQIEDEGRERHGCILIHAPGQWITGARPWRADGQP
jgi:hypothetical protein